ncbi:class I SAM-dependent methyltransferase [Brucella haematophila]|uniref:class I SAM-dependent methyltransferase n=1 Tax=Brucella haematophila TaxID=419474 RepID=UPI00110EC111|nr:class I SAM-dependent methyltransferase [Brucella haematophila]TMV04502.1 class I SAM-dependent methyltransferase [Brucella haematophila]
MASGTSFDSVAYYDRLAADFGPQYDAVSFDLVHPNLALHLPVEGRVLDIGAGSGRDARALAARGLEVIAVEPSMAFRRVAVANGVKGVTWVDDRLPKLALLDKIPPFDFILCSAVLMLLDDSDFWNSFQRMAHLLADTGLLAVDVRNPMPNEPVDIFYAHPDAQVLEAAARAGLDCIDYSERNDALGRSEYRWRSYIFAHANR